MPASTDQTLDAAAPRTDARVAPARPAAASCTSPVSPHAAHAVHVAAARDAAVSSAAAAELAASRSARTALDGVRSPAPARGTAWRAASEPPGPARLSAMALEMLSRLPEGLLATTAARFPRVLDVLARAWGSPARFHRELDRLVFDERGGREGFPPAVLAELSELRMRYERWVGPASRLGR